MNQENEIELPVINQDVLSLDLQDKSCNETSKEYSVMDLKQLLNLNPEV